MSGGGIELMASFGRDAITNMKYSGNAESAVTDSRIDDAGWPASAGAAARAPRPAAGAGRRAAGRPRVDVTPSSSTPPSGPARASGS